MKSPNFRLSRRFVTQAVREAFGVTRVRLASGELGRILQGDRDRAVVLIDGDPLPRLVPARDLAEVFSGDSGKGST